MRTWWQRPIAPFALVVALLVGACGGEAEDASGEAPTELETAAAPATEDGAVDDTATEAAAGGSATETLGTVTVGVAVLGANIYWDLYVADQEGFFEEAGVQVEEFISFSGPSDTISALAGGSVDVIHLATDGVLLAAEQGVDIRLIAGGSYPASSLLVDDSIESYDDLVGKKFGVTDIDAGSTQIGLALMRANGVDPVDDMEIVPVGGGSPDRLAALQQGVIDAALMGQPFDLRAQREGIRLLGNTAEVLGSYPYISVATMAEYASAGPELLSAYVGAIVEAQEWVNDPANKERAIEIFMPASDSDQELATEVYELYIEELGAMPTGGEFDPEGVTTLLEVLNNTTAGAGVTQEDFDAILDTSFLP